MAHQPWSETLDTSSFDGVEFECVSTKRSFGLDIDKRAFPYGRGVDIDVRGVKGKSVQLLIPIIEDDYPSLMHALLDAFEGGVKEYVDNVFGSIKAVVEVGTITHDVTDGRDSAMMEITVVEHSDQAATAFVVRNTLAGLANTSRGAADDALQAIQAYEDSLDATATPAQLAAPDQARDASNQASAASTALEDTGADLSASEIAATVNHVLGAISVVLAATDNYTTAESYALGIAMRGMATGLGGLGDALINAKPPIVTRPVLAEIPFLAWVHAQYGSSDRALEVLALNSIADPLMLPLGAKVQLYAL